MSSFSGTYTAKVDKGRCFFPAQFRKKLGEGDVAHLKMRITENDAQYIEIYEENDWEERVAKMKQIIESDEKKTIYEKEDYVTEYTSAAEDITIELKSETNSPNVGRMLIPKTMIDKLHIKNEVVFMGTVGMIRLWAKESYDNRLTKDLKAMIIEQTKNKKE